MEPDLSYDKQNMVDFQKKIKAFHQAQLDDLVGAYRSSSKTNKYAAREVSEIRDDVRKVMRSKKMSCNVSKKTLIQA